MRRVVLAIVSTVTGLVMLLSFKTHTAATATAPYVPPTTGGTTNSDTSGAGDGSTSSDTTPTTSPTQGTTSTDVSKTVTGDSIDTRWGPVQVKITVTNGKITAADAVVYPQENPRDQEINSYAVPTLNQEAVAAGDANIDMVSGATYTSDGYIQSLQSALNKAKS